MSDVTRDENGLHDGISGPPADVLGRLEGGPSGPAHGPRPSIGLAARVGRLAPRARARDRIADLTAATDASPGRIAVFPWIGSRAQLISEAIEDRRVVVTHLRTACMAERRRGIARHWTYSKARHDALARLLEREEAELHQMMEVA